MAINLPNSPTNGQTVTLADKTLVYNSTSGTWNVQTTDSSGGSLSISDTAPSSPSDGDMWFDSSTLTLYAYYDDGNSQQWIDLAGQATTLQATSSDTAPANPSTGAIWFDTANLNLFVYYSDGSSNQWVQMNSEAPAIPEDISDLTDSTNLLFDGQYSSLTGAPTSSTAGALGTLTKTFAQNEESEITLSETISPVPNVSVFKEVPQGGLTSKGNWDVNANATNYEFFDEKPLNYNTTTLTPSATGDGTFDSSNPISRRHIPASTAATTYATYGAGFSGGQFSLNNSYWGSALLSDDGTKFWMVRNYEGTNSDEAHIYAWTLSTPFRVDTAAAVGSAAVKVITEMTNISTMLFNNDGTKIVCANGSNFYQFDLSTAYDLSTMGSGTESNWRIDLQRDPLYIDWSGDGTKLITTEAWTSGGNSTRVRVFDLNTSYDITTMANLPVGTTTSFDATNPYYSIYSANIYQKGWKISQDGLKFYAIDSGNGKTLTKELPSPWVMRTGTVTTGDQYGLGDGNNWLTAAGDDYDLITGNYSNVSWTQNGSAIIIFNGAIAPNYLDIIPLPATQAFSSTDVGKKVVGNSGSAVITATSGTYKSVTAFADTSAISSWTLNSAQGKADGSGIELSGTSQVGTPLNHGTYNSTSAGITYTGYYSLYSNGGVQYGSASHFGPDGTKFYSWTSSTNVRIWSPTTAFDISTLGNSVINVGGFSANGGQCIRFSKTGDKVFHLGSNGYSLHSYDLSTPYDLSTKGSVTTKTMSFQGTGSVDTMGWYQNNVTVGSGGQHMGNFVISPDGSYFVGECRTVNGALVRGVMSTPYDISTLVLNQSLARGVGITAPGTQSARNRSGSAPAWNQGGGIWFSDDGKLALWWGSAAVVEGFQYRFSTGWDFSTASGVYDGTTNNMGWSPPAPSGNSSRDVGTTAIEIGTKPDGQVIMQATMFWNNSALSPEQEVIVSYNLSADPNSSSIYPYSVYSPVLTGSTGQINSSSWVDLDSMVADETKNDGDVFYAVSTDNRTSWDVIKNGDGVRKIAKNNSGTWQYNNDAGTTVSVGYDLSNASYTTISPLLAQSEGYEYMHFKPDGTKVWIGGPNQDTIYEYDLSTGFDLSTITYGRSFAFSTSSQSQGFFMKSDGTRAYISDYTSDIFQLDLSTAWDITTASYSSVVLNLGSGNYSKDIYIKSDGTKLYNVANNNVMKQFTMATPWDLSTATLDHTVTLADSFTYGSITFNSDGTILFIAHVNTSPAALRAVNSYSLSTAWDISSTLTLITNYDIFPEIGGHIASGIGFNGDGSKMYIMSAENTSTSPGRRILEYSTGGTTINYGTSETWVNGTNNNEHATLQEALGAQSFNRMDKTQLQTVTDPNHYVLGDTLDLMIAPYAASGTSPLSDGVTIGYQADALIKQAINGTDYEAEFPATNKVKIKSLAAQNLKIRII